jgi:RHS repeat-associated protein
VFYVHTDHLNTPRLVTDLSNNIRWRWDSDPFGTTVPNENPSTLGTFVYNLRFPGQQYDAVVGLHYNYFRDYDPAVGEYLEADPLGLLDGNNLYSYVSSDPTLFADPQGLFRGDPDRYRRLLNPRTGAGLLGRTGAAGLVFSASYGVGTIVYDASEREIQEWLDQFRDDCRERRCKPATHENIRSVLNSSPMVTIQRGIWASGVQMWVEAIELGNAPPPISADENYIVDGHHRYVASILCGVPISARRGTRPLSATPFPMSQMVIH